jgi:hypothetical protein
MRLLDVRLIRRGTTSIMQRSPDIISALKPGLAA